MKLTEEQYSRVFAACEDAAKEYTTAGVVEAQYIDLMALMARSISIATGQEGNALCERVERSEFIGKTISDVNEQFGDERVFARWRTQVIANTTLEDVYMRVEPPENDDRLIVRAVEIEGDCILVWLVGDDPDEGSASYEVHHVSV